MAQVRTRRRGNRVDYWPGFVDALSTLLLAIMFLLSVFVLAQFLLSQEISGKDTVLNRLNSQINELTSMLALERSNRQDLEDSLAVLQSSLATAESDRTRLQQLLDEGAGSAGAAEARAGKLSGELDEERKLSKRALSQVQLLNQQISALRRQIAALEDALDASETRDRESKTKIADLGRRLNVALAQRVQELSRYRSDFFGRLREILSDRSDIRVVGDRFVFQSEVLFSSGSATINEQGQAELTKLAGALLQLSEEIPDEINWVLRVDGHTDDRALSGRGRFKNNWELSSFRALSVVQFLISQGVSPDRLVAAGFGEFQPIEEGDTPGCARQEPAHRVETDRALMHGGASHREMWLSGIGGGLSILTTYWLTGLVADIFAVKLLFVASMGASAVLLFALPRGPLSQPWNVIGGHLISALVGVGASKLIAEPVIAGGGGCRACHHRDVLSALPASAGWRNRAVCRHRRRLGRHARPVLSPLPDRTGSTGDGSGGHPVQLSAVAPPLS